MNSEVLLAIILSAVEERFAELPLASAGPRGPRGPSGNDGRDFVFGEHEDKIRNFAKEFALKFSDLTIEQVESLRGPRGKDGRDGKPFQYDEHAEAINEEVQKWAKEFALKFSDLTQDQTESLRGPRGREGAAGRDFNFEENKERISELVRDELNKISPDLKLNFSDLTPDDKEELRGPKGERGPRGKDFVFDEHIEFFKSLKLKFDDLTEDEKHSLRLKFGDLTDLEKSELKLKFSDLTDEDKISLKGPRGQRGKIGPVGLPGERGERGDVGPKGDRGERGIRGLPGFGTQGRSGRDGKDGKDAPYITEIELNEGNNEFNLLFHLSDGTVIETNPVRTPKNRVETYIVGGTSAAMSPSGPQTVARLTHVFETSLTSQVLDLVKLTASNFVDTVGSNDALEIPKGIFGVIYGKPTPTTAEVIFIGVISGEVGLTPGEVVRVQPDGTVGHAQVATGISQSVGFAITPTSYFLQIGQPFNKG